MTVREAVRGDGQRLAAIDAVTRSADVSPAPRAAHERDFWSGGLRPGDVLVAEEAGEVVASLVTGHPTPLPSNRHVFEIKGLAVDPECQRKGVAGKLLASALKRLRACGAEKVSLRVLATNERARRFYESQGFDVEGVPHREFYVDGQPVDDVLMAKFL